MSEVSIALRRKRGKLGFAAVSEYLSVGRPLARKEWLHGELVCRSLRESLVV